MRNERTLYVRAVRAMTALIPILVVAPLMAGPVGTRVGVDAVSVKLTNPLRATRSVETIALPLPDLLKLAPTLEFTKTIVRDGVGNPVESQLVDMDGDEKPDELVFQTGFAAAETKTFIVEPGQRLPPARTDFKAYGRFVRERHDDFAWENDHVAHRMYGPDLETWKAEPLTSSGIDVWCKRVPRLVINDWYMTDNYHQDSGEGADLYSVGRSRGCGGSSIWVGDKPHVSRNFTNSRVLANGPIRLVFELSYAPWDTGDRGVSETKRIIVDAGQNFDRFESTFKADGTPPSTTGGRLAIGMGIAKHDGGVFEVNTKAGWMRSWEPLKQPNGNLGCAVIASPRAVAGTKQTEADQYLILDGRAGVPSVTYAGFAWDRSGDVADSAGWTKLVDGFARGLTAPLRVSLAAIKVAGTATGTATTTATTTTTTTVNTSNGHDHEHWSTRTCDAVMARSPILTDKWSYDAGLVLKGCLQVWRASKDHKYLDYVRQNVDRFIDADGHIQGYKIDDYNLDNVNMGKLLFPLLKNTVLATDKDRYRKALLLLESQLKTQPRTSDGGFWHKRIYPKQMWLDGVYMASPFLAELGVVFDEPALVDEAARQVLLAEKHMRDPHSGLLYHGWNESKEQAWANPKTGTSSQFWGRGMGWYAMAVVDVLEQMPRQHPQREAVLAVLHRLARAIASVQDKTSGVWWQVLDAPARAKNYEEASASSMFVYALAKAVKNGWIDGKPYGNVASRGYRGVVAKFVDATADGQVNVKGICKVAGLGGDPHRDGSFDYYTSTDIVVNDPKGVGAFILASAENEGS